MMWKSTVTRRLVVVFGIGSAVTGVLWVVHLQTTGLVWMFATVGSLAAAALTVALAAWLIVEGWTDARARSRTVRRLRSTGRDVESTSDRCQTCRRPLVVTGGMTLCMACDQRPAI